MNEYGIDYACPGFCNLCHDPIAEFSGSVEVVPGVFRLKISRLLPNFRSLNVKMSDGSTMTVTLCDKCEDLKPDQVEKLMESEQKGWEREVRDLLPNKTLKWKEDCLKQHECLSIIDRADQKWSPEETKLLASKHAEKVLKQEKLNGNSK